LVLVLAAATASAQTVGVTAGAITGTVSARTGAVLPAVSVAITSDALMRSRTVETNEDGLYRFVALPPGQYTVVFNRAGFKPARREQIHVGIGFTATINVELDIAAPTEEVIVERRSPVIDAQATSIAATFDAHSLADLPSARSMWALQAMTPAVHVPRFDFGGGVAGLGGPVTVYGTAGFNRPMVEGISVTGINPTGFTLNYGSFDEVSIHTAAHGPEWHAPGIHMQFISKSGGNQYHGTLYADTTRTDWQSFNIEDREIRGNNRLSSYYDVNADIGGYIKPDTAWWYFSVRKQDIVAREVNFPVKPLRTSLTNFSGKSTYQLTPGSTLIGFGQAGRNYQPNRLDPFGPSGSGVAPATAINVSEESTSEQVAWGWVWKGEWNAAINDTLYFESRAGQFGANRPERPNGAAQRFEDVGNLIVTGGNRDWQQNYRRDQVIASLSYFKNGWRGQHHFKTGGEIFQTRATEIWKRAYPGDVLHVLQNGQPTEVYLFETPSRSENGLWTYSAYGGDSWRMNSRVTLNLGVRFDRYRVFLPQQRHPAGRFNPVSQTFAAIDNLIDWNVLTPRLGAALDLAGDGRTIVKLSYGRYRLAPGNEIGNNANPNANVWWRRYGWSDLNRNGMWDDGEQGTGAVESRGGAAIESLDRALELPVFNEVAAWLEREWFSAIGIRTGVVWRGQGQHYVRQNATWPFDAFTAPITIFDPGPDGRSATADDGGAIQAFELPEDLSRLEPTNIVRNVPRAESQYWTWDVTATRRFAGRWSLTAGLAHTWNQDQASRYLGQAVRQNTYPLTPNDLINADDSGAYAFRIWSAKVYGTYEGRWGLRVTPFVRHQSGQPFGRTFVTTFNYARNVRVLAEPMGTRRMDNVTLADVRLEKGFRVARARVAGFVDVFNLFNANPEQNTSWSSGQSFLRPLSIVPPRLARLGAKLEW
jgi:hypothetical protein